MRTYTIPKKSSSFYGIASFSIEGIVTVDYPKAAVSVTAKATLCSDHVYKVSLDPSADRWSDSDTHKWTMKSIPVTLRISIDKADMKTVHVEVVGEKGKRFWSDSYDIYDPFKTRKVEAWAQGAFGPGIEEHADHTYGIGFSDTGERNYLWPCGGDHDGKDAHCIATGEALEPECDCLSQRLADPLTKGLAGIVYGVDGVCHQAANRILCTAGLEVNGAKGYKKAGGEKSWKHLTYYLYGRLGIKREGGSKKWEEIKSGCLCKTYPYCSEEPGEHVEIGNALGLSGDHASAIGAAAEAARSDFIDTYARLSAGAISPREYADALNGRISDFVTQLRESLGEQVHQSLFGDLPDSGLVIVEPAICEAVFAKGAPPLV